MTIRQTDTPTSSTDASFIAPPAIYNAINVGVLRPDDTRICFFIKKTSQLDRLMRAYCETTNQRGIYVRFLYCGRIVNELDTPSSLGMEEGDVLEASH